MVRQIDRPEKQTDRQTNGTQSETFISPVKVQVDGCMHNVIKPVVHIIT